MSGPTAGDHGLAAPNKRLPAAIDGVGSLLGSLLLWVVWFSALTLAFALIEAVIARLLGTGALLPLPEVTDTTLAMLAAVLFALLPVLMRRSPAALSYWVVGACLGALSVASSIGSLVPSGPQDLVGFHTPFTVLDPWTRLASSVAFLAALGALWLVSRRMSNKRIERTP